MAVIIATDCRARMVHSGRPGSVADTFGSPRWPNSASAGAGTPRHATRAAFLILLTKTCNVRPTWLGRARTNLSLFGLDRDFTRADDTRGPFRSAVNICWILTAPWNARRQLAIAVLHSKKADCIAKKADGLWHMSPCILKRRTTIV